MTSSSHHRDGDGLTLPQRKVLMDIATGKSIREACAEEDVRQTTFVRWMREPAFKQNLDGMFSLEDLANLKTTLHIAAAQSVEVYESAMQANRKIKIVRSCPKCGEDSEYYVEIEDWKARLHAADTLLKISGVLVQRQELKASITVQQKQLTYEQQMALMAWRGGRPIPPHFEDELRHLGYIEERPALPSGSNETVGGSVYTILEEDEDD